jgi:uncharacterized delta-60 repeat protein
MITRMILFLTLFCSLQAADVPGTINTSFGHHGVLYLEDLSDVFVGAVPTVILPMEDGSQYIACNVPDSYSFIAKLTSENLLDTSYGTNGISASTNFGVNSMMMDGQGRLVVSGLYPNDPTGWISRYVAGDFGDLDLTFNDGYGIFHYNWIFNKVVQQTPSRYLVAGQDHETGYMTLWAFTDDGKPDLTFNCLGSAEQGRATPGFFQLPVHVNLYAIATDEYDRIYLAVRNTLFDMLYVMRLTSFGQIDTNFGLVDVMQGCDDDAQIRLSFDASGNVVVAAHILGRVEPAMTPSPYIAVAGINQYGQIIHNQCNFTVPNDPTLTNFIATSDGKLLIAGYQSAGEHLMWVAQVTLDDQNYILDTTFNPLGSYGNIPGIMQFSFQEGVIANNLTSFEIYPGGQISILGTQTDASQLGFISRAYDAIDITQEIICQNSKPLGTNDLTFGVANPPVNGIEFLAITRSSALPGQAAQAVALQNDATILVAIDGQLDPEESDDPSKIFLNIFTVDGLLDTQFDGGFAPGQAIILEKYQDQYVRDMLAFSSSDGIDKTLMTGYVTNQALGSNNLFLAQYVVTPESPGLDQSFGGYNGDALGIVLATGSSQGFTVHRQSIGRIIVTGFDPGNSAGIVQGYTPSGLLDESFGVGGYFTQGYTGIYVSLIDSLDRILIAYNDGNGNLIISRILADGSGLDQTFGIDGTLFIPFNDESGLPLSSNNSFNIVFDTQENILLAAILQEGTIIAIDKFDVDGQDCTASSSFDATRFGEILDNFRIGSLLINQQSHLVVAGAENNNILVFQIVQDDPDHLGFLVLDANFNAADTPGYIRYNIDDELQTTITDGLIHPDGRYIFIGYKPQNIG